MLNRTWKILGIASALLVVGTVGFSPAGFANEQGGEVSGGGVAVVCRDATQKGKITEAFLLDTFEGKYRYRLNIPHTDAPIEEQIERTAAKIPTLRFRKLFDKELARVRKNWAPYESEIGMTPTDDAFPKLKKKHCEFEQAARYLEDGTVEVDSEILPQLSKTDQAALYVHEVVYAIARKQARVKSSVDSRELTAHLFSESPSKERMITLIGKAGALRLTNRQSESLVTRAWLAAEPNFGLIDGRKTAERVLVESMAYGELENLTDYAKFTSVMSSTDVSRKPQFWGEGPWTEFAIEFRKAFYPLLEEEGFQCVSELQKNLDGEMSLERIAILTRVMMNETDNDGVPKICSQ